MHFSYLEKESLLQKIILSFSEIVSTSFYNVIPILINSFYNQPTSSDKGFINKNTLFPRVKVQPRPTFKTIHFFSVINTFKKKPEIVSTSFYIYASS